MLTLAQLLASGVFCTTAYFRTHRTGLEVAPSALTPLLILAVATGLLGGLTAPAVGASAPVHVRVQL